MMGRMKAYARHAGGGKIGAAVGRWEGGRDRKETEDLMLSDDEGEV
jgi:hypothetical protein